MRSCRLDHPSACTQASCGQACAELGTEPDPSSDPLENCLPISVPEGTCTDRRYPIGNDCAEQPYADCVELSTPANVFCCKQ